MPSKKKKAAPTGETKAYCVSIPIAGTATITVEAISEEDAKRKAWEAVDNGEEVETAWEYFERLVEGNCLHAPHNEVEVGEA